jgi:hypothetical protein
VHRRCQTTAKKRRGSIDPDLQVYARVPLPAVITGYHMLDNVYEVNGMLLHRLPTVEGIENGRQHAVAVNDENVVVIEPIYSSVDDDDSGGDNENYGADDASYDASYLDVDNGEHVVVDTDEDVIVLGVETIYSSSDNDGGDDSEEGNDDDISGWTMRAVS